MGTIQDPGLYGAARGTITGGYTNEDWATQKKAEKDKRSSTHLGFINYLCRREKNGWKVTQTNFTTGV